MVHAEKGSLLYFQQKWARIKYGPMEEEQKIEALELLASGIEKQLDQEPNNVELKIWLGTVISTRASLIGGLSALPLVERARDLLEQALVMDDKAMDGYAYGVLASLYHKVPGWPVAFGDDEKAERYFNKALALNPGGLDVNFFYAEYLEDEGDYAEAKEHLEKALQAPDRQALSKADEGRRAEVKALLEAVNARLNRKAPRPSYN